MARSFEAFRIKMYGRLGPEIKASVVTVARRVYTTIRVYRKNTFFTMTIWALPSFQRTQKSAGALCPRKSESTARRYDSPIFFGFIQLFFGFIRRGFSYKNGGAFIYRRSAYGARSRRGFCFKSSTPKTRILGG